jgi:O-6-methylguanine DNA methyltransferase
MTYKEVAALAGNPRAARAVGAIMRTNYNPDIPCHRVVRSDGGMGGYNRGGADKKMEMLSKEALLAAAIA